MSLEEIGRIRAMLDARRGEQLTLEQRRARHERQAAAFPLPGDLRTETVRLRDGLDALWCEVDGVAADRVLVWLHGGGFFLGSPTSYRDFAARLARASGMRVLLPDYRLVPEHRFPAALEDGGAALDWLEAAGFAMTGVAIGGDSAGGNLAAAAVQARLDAGRPAPAAVVLLSPYLDLTHGGDSVAARAAIDPFVGKDDLPATAAAYLDGADPNDPRASPLFGTVDGFPPTLIQVGSDELLFDDARRFADRLREAGGAPMFQEWAGMIHFWHFHAANLEEARWAQAQIGVFLRRAMTATPVRAEGSIG